MQADRPVIEVADGDARGAALHLMEVLARRGTASPADMQAMQVFALLHVGDQLGRIADALAASPSPDTDGGA